MPVGDVFGSDIQGAGKIFVKFFGVFDLHTHLRIKAFLMFFKKYLGFYKGIELKVLEIGCGNGINAFHMAGLADQNDKVIRYDGVDISESAINMANDASCRINTNSLLRFYKDNAVNFIATKTTEAQYDCIVLMDVLEHLEDEKMFLGGCGKALKSGGIFVVSVPTRLYPKVFGRRFHEKVGHMREGYNEEELNGLFSVFGSSEPIGVFYNTGIVARTGCTVYYKFLRGGENRWAFLKAILTLPFRWLDIYNSSAVSATMFAVYRKV